MKMIKITILVLSTLLIFSCRGEGSGEKKIGQSSEAAAGQHIGATADSTTVDGKSGSMSNN